MGEQDCRWAGEDRFGVCGRRTEEMRN